METISAPKFTISYSGKDITEDVSRFLVSLKYQDKLKGASDELEITLEDSADLWKNEWYPGMGAKLKAEIGYDQLMPCGEFEIDEISMSIAPDTITLKALAVPVTGTLRTKKSVAHENTSLKDIAQKVASANGLTLQGEIDAMQFKRVTQNQETDLAFLTRIGKEYGYFFTVRAGMLIFSSVYKIEDGKSVRTIDRSQLLRCELKDKAAKTFKKATLAYHNPSTAKIVQATSTTKTNTNVDGATYTEIVAGDDLVIRARAEDETQANAKVKAYLHGANSLQQEGTITVSGDPLLVAGNNLELTGLGLLSGKYQIQESTHEIDKAGGYKTSVEIKRVGFVEITKHKKAPAKKRSVEYDVEEIGDESI